MPKPKRPFHNIVSKQKDEGKMSIYIRAAVSISPQHTFEQSVPLAVLVENAGNRMPCLEPDYKAWIDPKLIRRMGRIIKMGVVAALACLKEAQIQMPEAIITGTAMGCMEDSSVFLTKMVENKEEMLTPTAFIQSTHNTIGAQIALMLKCHQYNNTFVHRGFSFESALLDAIMLLNENEITQALVGGVDEITDISHNVQTRLGLYKSALLSNKLLFQTPTRGTIGGEGAAFFVLTNELSAQNYAQLEAVETFYKPTNTAAIAEKIAAFLAQQNTELADIDLIMTGRSGDPKNDTVFDALEQTLFSKQAVVYFKHLCGEYPTASSFALWLAAHILKKSQIPEIVEVRNTKPAQLKKVLIYNHFQAIHHTLMLVSAC
jgi:3-oxoacyl-[acyl-carrier-protein] synthase II